jgi:hypothetical protein
MRGKNQDVKTRRSKMLRGETIQSGASDMCCGKKLKLQVLHSNAGYYVGTRCPECGPYSRESGYYRNSQAAQKALDSGEFGR